MCLVPGLTENQDGLGYYYVSLGKKNYNLNTF